MDNANRAIGIENNIIKVSCQSTHTKNSERKTGIAKVLINIPKKCDQIFSMISKSAVSRDARSPLR